MNPDHHGAQFNLACTLQKQGKLDLAIAVYQRAIVIKPNHAEAHSNLGNALQEQGKLDEALACYQHALAIEPDHADAHWNTSFALLALGRFQEGWQRYEWRWKRTGAPKGRTSQRPLWLGQQSLHGKTILLWGEQGLGDQIQFARYAAVLARQGARVILEVDPPLVDLLSGLDDSVRVVSKTTPVSDVVFDVHCPLMSVPLACRTEASTIPPPSRFASHRGDVARWATILGDKPRRIGIAWSGSASNKADHLRSMPLEKFSSIMDFTIEWTSLQK